METKWEWKRLGRNYRWLKVLILTYDRQILLGYKRRTELHWVQIYFATPTFDLITKEEKANFVTKLSLIGGTLGLLAGFSIISGFEIIFFLVKLLRTILMKLILKEEKHCIRNEWKSLSIYFKKIILVKSIKKLVEAITWTYMFNISVVQFLDVVCSLNGYLYHFM